MKDDDPLRGDSGRISYVCPKCGLTLGEYAEQCPECGQNLSEAFSGSFRPRRSHGPKIVALLLLVVFVGAMIVVCVQSWWGLAMRR